MSATHPDEFRKLDAAELNERIDQLRTDLFNLRVQNTTKEIASTAVIRDAKRDLARALTILNQRRREQNAQGAGA